MSRGDITRLVINIPPGTMKSLLSSVFWPAWVWTWEPGRRWLFASYGSSLASRDSQKCRRLIQSDWYRERWPDMKLTTDQNVKTWFENDKTGVRYSTSVGGEGTGRRADCIVVDDPHNTKQAESDLERQSAIEWWDLGMSSRLDDPDRGGKVIMMQRLHEQDLTAHVLEQGGYEHLCLPMEYDPSRSCVTVLGRQDPRTDPDDLLWPERYSPRWVPRAKVEAGDYGWESQYQQSPTTRKGGLFERGWFSTVERAPREGMRLRYWDKAGTDRGGKYTAGVRMSVYRGLFYIEDVVRGQWSASLREPVLRQVADADAVEYGIGAVLIWIEQEPGSGGKESAESTIQNLAGHRVEAERPTGDKFVRAGPLAAQAKAGNVKLVRGDWNEEFLRELDKAGPGARFLDQMDAAAGAFNKLALGIYVDPEYEDEVEEGFVFA